MKKLLWLLVAIPVAVLLVVFAVTNRTPVTLSLDPFARTDPAISFTLPFFVFLFAALLAGMLLGGFATWLSQGRYRKSARLQKNEAGQWRREAEAQKNRADELAASSQGFPVAGLPAVPRRDRAA